MFEGRFPPADGRPAQMRHQDDEAELRPVTWGELVMRLSAARELRAALREDEQGGIASFDADSARRLASRGDGKWTVNLEDSGNGKGTGGTHRGRADGEESGEPRK